jgi:hypothetical protein
MFEVCFKYGKNFKNLSIGKNYTVYLVDNSNRFMGCHFLIIDDNDKFGWYSINLFGGKLA